MDGGFYLVGRIPLSFFFCNSTPAAPAAERFSPSPKKIVAFSVSMLHPKFTKFTVDVFQWAVPCVQNASSKCVILHLNNVEPISFFEEICTSLAEKTARFFVKANEQSASQSLPSSWGSSLRENSSVTPAVKTQAASTTRRDTRAAQRDTRPLETGSSSRR